jgi:SNF family Na+-dependent transporter
MLAIEGIPIFYLELAIGQRLRKGAIGVWNQVSPYLGGIGISSAVVSFNVALYYNTIIAWCLFYFVQVSITASSDNVTLVLGLVKSSYNLRKYLCLVICSKYCWQVQILSLEGMSVPLALFYSISMQCQMVAS